MFSNIMPMWCKIRVVKFRTHLNIYFVLIIPGNMLEISCGSSSIGFPILFL